MCDGSGMATHGNSPTGQENAPKPMQACVHSPTMVSSPSPRGLFGSGRPIFLAKWPILLAKHRIHRVRVTVQGEVLDLIEGLNEVRIKILRLFGEGVCRLYQIWARSKFPVNM